MVNMRSVDDFYAEENWRNLYGIKGPFYPVAHHGHDIRCAGREKIPCYRGGTVQPWRNSRVVGQTLSIRHGLGDYSGYCHLINRTARPGSVIAAGTFIAEAATWGDFTGTAWSGPHVHTVHGATAQCVFGIGTDDPAPYIRAVLATNSAAALKLAALSPKDLPTLMALKDTLTIFHSDRGYLVAGPGFSREIIGNERLDVLSRVVGIPAQEVGVRDWDVIAEFFRGNDEIAGVIGGVKESLDA